MEISVAVTGIESLETDKNAVLAGIKAAINTAMSTNGSVAAAMKEILLSHIASDVYGRYTPKEYPRRTANGGLVDPLNITFMGDTGLLIMSYEPDGWHWMPEWSTNKTSTEVISSIEKGNLAGNPPPREFWQNTVDELISDKKILEKFTEVMGELGYTIISEGTDIVRESIDGKY